MLVGTSNIQALFIMICFVRIGELTARMKRITQEQDRYQIRLQHVLGLMPAVTATQRAAAGLLCAVALLRAAGLLAGLLCTAGLLRTAGLLTILRMIGWTGGVGAGFPVGFVPGFLAGLLTAFG